MIKIRAIVPTGRTAFYKKLAGIPPKILKAAGDDAQAILDGATSTWSNKPKFTIKVDRAAGTATVGTTHKIFRYVNDGTKPHIIRPRRKAALRFGSVFVAKTIPNSLTSGAGKRGGTPVFTTIVNHPGTKARNFTTVAAKLMQKRMGQIAEKVIKAAL